MAEQAFHVLKKTSKGFMCLISYFSIFGYIAQKIKKLIFIENIGRHLDFYHFQHVLVNFNIFARGSGGANLTV